MDQLLICFLDKPVILKDQALIKISGYDMDYFEYEVDSGQVLIYRSHKNPIVTKVIILKDKLEFNYTLADNKMTISHFLEYYLYLNQLTSNHLNLVTGHLQSISDYLRRQANFYQNEGKNNVQIVNILPPELKQALRDYELLVKIVHQNRQQVMVKLFNQLNINVQNEFEFLQELANSHKLRI